jgi:hypothetical protein
MTRMRTAPRIFLLAAAVAAATSCGDVVRNSRAPVLIVIDTLGGASGKSTTFFGTLFSDVQTMVTTPAPCSTVSPCPTVINDVGQASMHLEPKDIGTTSNPATPSSNNQVTITRYHVFYHRADGRNTPGVDVPFAFDGAVTATIPAQGNVSFTFELVRIAAKEEGPLVQLINSPTIITAIADITFYGTDLVGNEIKVMGSITVEFGNFADAQ